MTRSNLILASVFAAALSAQQAQNQQPVIVYYNGQPMMLTPVPVAPMQQPVQTTNAIMPAQPQLMPQQPAIQMQPNHYGNLPQYVGAGAGVTGTQARRLSLPTGTPVFVRLISSLSSNRLIPGAAFEASLDSPMEVNGFVVAERGARVEGRVTEAAVAGKISGQSQLALTLMKIVTADGKTLDLSTNTIALAGGTSYGRDAAKIAGLAGVGAALGAINSGRGAAIGSAAGAAAGIGLVLNTRGKATTVASEQRLEFHLIAPTTFVTW